MPAEEMHCFLGVWMKAYQERLLVDTRGRCVEFRCCRPAQWDKHVFDELPSGVKNKDHGRRRQVIAK